MLNLIYDATLLTNYFHKDAARSGIFFVAINVLKELVKRRDVHVTLYIDPELSGEGARIKKELYPDMDFLFDYSKHLYLIKINQMFWNVHNRLYARVFLRKIVSLGIVVTQKLLGKVFAKDFLISNKSKKIFFSPAYKIPDAFRKCQNINCALIIHDIIPLKFREYGNVGWARYLNDILKTSKKEDYFFAISNSTKKDFMSISPIFCESNIFVSHLAAADSFRSNCNLDLLKVTLEKYKIPKKKYIFSLCTIEPRKNLIRAIRSFMLFVKKHKIDNLIWVMGGGEWNSFVREMKRKKIEWNSKYIIRAGYIDDSDLPVLYSNAEWFVYTSQYEGFGLPPLEAMQCGCPIITSNNSSLPEVVGDAGIMIDWDSDEQHIEAYEKYYFDENLRNENSRKGIERAKLFSWKKTVDEMIDVMQKNY